MKGITMGATAKTLMGYIGTEPMRKVVKTRMFGGPYLRYYDYLLVSSYLYEMGALIGYARRDKLQVLEKMIGKPKKVGESIAFIQKEAKNRLHKLAEVPNSFFDLFVLTDLALYGMSFETPINELKKRFDEKIPLDDVVPIIVVSGTEGIGFGSAFPELTEKFYRNYHENIDMSEWSRWHNLGLAISEKPDVIAFEEQQQIVLAMVASYARDHYPDLVQKLDLSSY